VEESGLYEGYTLNWSNDGYWKLRDPEEIDEGHYS
jgi:hypothetical protein